MRTYRIAPLRRETEGWTVIRSSPGEADETLGHYVDHADAQTAWEHLVAAEAEGEAGSQPDTRYEIFQDDGAYKIRITRFGSFKREADGFASRADAESWIAQAKRLGAVRAGQQEIAPSHLKVVKP